MEGQVSRRFGEEIKNLSLSGLGFSYLFLKAKESKAADADTPSLLFGNNNKDASLGAAVNTATIVARGVCFPLAGSDGPVLAQDPAPGPSGLTPSPPHCPHPHTTGSPTWAVSTQVQVRSSAPCHRRQVMRVLAHACVHVHTHTHAQTYSSLGLCHLRFCGEAGARGSVAEEGGSRGAWGWGPVPRAPQVRRACWLSLGRWGSHGRWGPARLVHGSVSGEPDFTLGSWAGHGWDPWWLRGPRGPGSQTWAKLGGAGRC